MTEEKRKFRLVTRSDFDGLVCAVLLKDMDMNHKTKRLLIEDFDKVLSLDLLKEFDERVIDKDYEKMIFDKIEERAIAKKNKDFAKADQIRDELYNQGVQLIDSREGTTYELVLR